MLLEIFFFFSLKTSGDPGRPPADLSPASTSGRQAGGKVIQPNLDHLDVRLKAVKVFSEVKKRKKNGGTTQAFLQELALWRYGP